MAEEKGNRPINPILRRRLDLLGSPKKPRRPVCNLESYAYLRYLFEQLPLAKGEDDLRQLMPQYIDPAQISSSSAS